MVGIVNDCGTARPPSGVLVAGAVRRDMNGARIRRHIFHDFRWPSVSGFAKLMLEAGDPRHKDSCHDWPLTLAKLVDQPSIPYSPFIRSTKHVNSFGLASEWFKSRFWTLSNVGLLIENDVGSRAFCTRTHLLRYQCKCISSCCCCGITI